MPQRLRYQDYYDEMATSQVAGVFIDDTGSPGLAIASPHLHPERKSWVGVVVPPWHLPDVLQQFPRAVQELQRLTGATEFHFVDIYGGRREFKGVEPGVRVGLFEFMAWLFTHYQLPIFVQTFDPTSEAVKYFREKFPDKIGPFDFGNHEHLALFLLLIRIQWYLRDDCAGAAARVWIDEGIQRNGVGIQIPGFRPYFVDGMICFADSSSVSLLQLADFAAFGLNRTQMLLGKESLTEPDRLFADIFSRVAGNYQNIEKRTLDVDNWNPFNPPTTPS